MKTTGGKTKHVRPEARPINIYADGHRGLIAVRRASTLRQALLEYAKETLEPQGATRPKVVGNVLTINTKGGTTVQYIALETHQQHLVK